MIKRIMLLSVVFISIIPFYSVEAQTTNSTNVEQSVEEIPLIVYWEKAPQLNNTTNKSVLCELCEIIKNDSFKITYKLSNGSYKGIIVNLRLDKKGNPVWVDIYSEIIDDSLIDEITKLIYRLEFEPAEQGGISVSSDFMLHITPKNCELFYKSINAIPSNRREKRRNRNRQYTF